MLAIPFAILHEFKLFLHCLAILLGSIVASLAFAAGECDDFDDLLLAGHDSFLENRIMHPQSQTASEKKWSG
jgi:hypothetical protein